MKTVIIPVDFSETSLNAARFAAQMLSGSKDTRIVLYSMFEDEEDSETTGTYLESLKAELELKGNKEIECVKELADDLIDSIERLVFQKAATLVVMGITGKSPIKQLLVGSNTLKLVEKNICPVMIIPPDAAFNGVNNILFTSDFQEVKESTPVLYIKTVLDFFKANLHIVNVSNEHYVSLTEQFQSEREKLLGLLKEYNPEFYFIGMNDFHEAIEQFVKDKNIDLIITIPRFHSGITSIFKLSATKKLVFHSSVPVLAAHEKM
ncbi:MAG: universal stress protein [Chitinophagaceae bacterium]|nr:universal stress protein [Chitinophagaceae bacterium]